jgi:trehalose synthase
MTRSPLVEVDVRAIAPEELAAFVGVDRAELFAQAAARARTRLDGRRVINVNSTATGGGVAELLQTLLAYARGVGIDARWLVIDGDAGFFEITKRIHNHLYGTAGDGGSLGDAEHEQYEQTIARNVAGLGAVVRAGDVVILHDPQTAALARAAMPAGVTIVWRCHVGIDTQNEHSARAWAFLRPYLDDVDAFVFSRAQFAPPWVTSDRLAVIPPSIDPFSAKNAHIESDDVHRVLQDVGLLAGGRPDGAVAFTRRDGSKGAVTTHVNLLDTGPPPPPTVPIVLQASRWDVMKDMPGVMIGFAEGVVAHTDAHLILAGPEASGVADDPEAAAVLRGCLETWRALPDAIRRRVHLACVPMTDGDEAATVVNALQRHAAVVVQKSLAEGFGLTVTEAMWKSRPVVGSAVGGIVDQIVSGETGWLVDAHNLTEYAQAVRALLDDSAAAERMGAAGRERAAAEFLGDRHLEQWAQLLERLA